MSAIKPLFTISESQSCEEFAHIHFHNFFKKYANTSTITQIDDHNDCHEGKVLSDLLVLELLPVIAGPPDFSSKKHSIILSLIVFYPDPDLEPHRKPPRLA